MLAEIGTIMIARIRIAGSIPACCGVPLKSGIQPNHEWSHGSRWSRTKGPSTKIPQSPRTTLGTAASISISEPITPRTAGGASSVRKSAIAIASGPAISTAANDVTAVP